jgi:hypothetical protein
MNEQLLPPTLPSIEQQLFQMYGVKLDLSKLHRPRPVRATGPLLPLPVDNHLTRQLGQPLRLALPEWLEQLEH